MGDKCSECKHEACLPMFSYCLNCALSERALLPGSMPMEEIDAKLQPRFQTIDDLMNKHGTMNGALYVEDEWYYPADLVDKAIEIALIHKPRKTKKRTKS